MNRVLRNHDLYCTVCDNNNGNCVIHNTAMQMRVEHQRYPFTPKGYAVDASNPFYRYDPISASSAGAAWKPARTSRSAKCSRLPGIVSARVSSGTPMCRSTSRRASRAATASPSARAMR